MDQKAKASSIDNFMTLHTGLAAALSSFKEACEIMDGIEWSPIPMEGRFIRMSNSSLLLATLWRVA